VEVEVVVVDDGSADGTRAWLDGHTDDRVRSRTNAQSQGVAEARNSAIAAARGEWLAFLDDDDFWAPQYLSSQLQAARAADADLAAASAVVVTAAGSPSHMLWAPQEQDLLRALYATNVFGGPSRVIARADAVRAVGGFDPALTVMADWDLWIRLLRSHRAAVTMEALVAVTQHSENMQITLVDTIAREIELIRAKHASHAAAVGASIGSAQLYRWLGNQYRRAGRRRRAARTYLAVGRRYRLRRDLLRVIVVLLGDRVVWLARGRRTPPQPPDWLAQAPAAPTRTNARNY
jgi:glycosyltransferase involved in cell wall biosynthesis